MVYKAPLESVREFIREQNSAIFLLYSLYHQLSRVFVSLLPVSSNPRLSDFGKKRSNTGQKISRISRIYFTCGAWKTVI